MPKILSPETQARIRALYAAGHSSRAIGRELNIDHSSVTKYAGTAAPEPLVDRLRRKLRSGAASAKDLAKALHATVPQIHAAVEQLRASGVLLMEYTGGIFELITSASLPPGRHTIVGNPRDEWTHTFGLTSDNHLCNRQSRLDVLNAAYRHFSEIGITTVFNTGNWIDGEARFNKSELLTAPGMDNQLDYLIDIWPVHAGITTHYIAGDDHEGWYQQREGIEVGQYLQMRAAQQGRDDLKYLGYAECDVALQCGAGSAVMRVLHPGGGSAYATSYSAQKIVESYQGGEKPQVLLIGHYHKSEYGFPREVHCIQAGCTEDQSLFMRKKKIAAHVGFWVFRIKQNQQGVITRFATEWFPFFDRGFYEKRYR